ncbi:MAG: spore maturation protein [Clostridiales bacterium]|nr:spore maturation protein [Clostridiales bacterium]
MKDVSASLLSIFLMGVVLYGTIRRTDCFAAFSAGARDGFTAAIHVMPYLCGMLIGVRMMRASGVFDAMASLLTPLARAVGLPPETLGIAVVRPFSGGAALAMLADVLSTYGADGLIGRTACILVGCSETVFYTASVYYGAVGIKDYRYTISACMIHTLVGMACAGFFARLC